MLFAVDTGGTFTDLVVEDEDSLFHLYKTPTVPEDPAQGVLDVLMLAAHDNGMELQTFLQAGDLFIHGTTRATNAILTESTAKTGLLVTEGHPDILLFREGGRTDVFNWTRAYPDPYIPRRLTFEIPERIGASGEIVQPLDEAAVVEALQGLSQEQVEAIAVCFLWSIANPAHELRVGALIEEHLAGLPYTLSHAVNPTIREYRRASAASLDASLKPVMASYLSGLTDRLRSAGFRGRVLVVTSSGGLLDAGDMARTPIYAIGSGPAMAPVAGRYYAKLEGQASTAVVADAGGTSYDVSVVRRGRIPYTRETWLGPVFAGHMTGFPSVDVRSIGAGGGSIGWVDEGGLLHVGPQSAGANPGPACYLRGGEHPTVTDAALVLGYVDPDYFLGGSMTLSVEGAKRAINEHIGKPLRLDVTLAAAAVMQVVTEHMARATEELTIKQGIDPRDAVLVAGGGAAGLNAVAIARRLGCPQVLIPEVAATLSAAGALMSDLSSDFSATFFTTSASFDLEGVNAILQRLMRQCEAFIAGPGQNAVESDVEFRVEARYAEQIWEIDVPVQVRSFRSQADVDRLRDAFHSVHEEIFAVQDPTSRIEFLTWHARVNCRLRSDQGKGYRAHSPSRTDTDEGRSERLVFFPETGLVPTPVRLVGSMMSGDSVRGPGIIESPITTVVVDSGAVVDLRPSGTLAISPRPAEAAAAAAVDRRSGNTSDEGSLKRAGEVF